MTRNINTRLKELIEKTGYSMVDFSKKIDVSRQTLYYMLAKDAKPGYEVIHGIASNFPWLNLRWLITGEGTMELETERRTNEDLRNEIDDLRGSLEKHQAKLDGMEASIQRKEKQIDELLSLVTKLVEKGSE